MAQRLPLLLLSLLFLASAPVSSTSTGFRARLFRAEISGNFNKAAERGSRRLAAIAAKITKGASYVEAPVHKSGGAFLMELAIGTPAFRFWAIADTGSDLIWTQCKPCHKCAREPTPLFDPAKSSTFAKLPCSSELCMALSNETCSNKACTFFQGYGRGSLQTSAQGFLASETFTFGEVSVPAVGFGCVTRDHVILSGSSGLVGLGMGPLSLVSQLQAGKFSYCLDSDANKTSPLLFGSLATISGSKVQSTPLHRSLIPGLSSFYYLNLTGISVGGKLLPIPSTAFALRANGSGGLFIDSGTTLTYLEVEAYKLVKRALVSQVKLPVRNATVPGLDLCFSIKSVPAAEFPPMTLHFEGADMDVGSGNYMVRPAKHIACLGMGRAPANGASILGNRLQQDKQILYDIKGLKLQFAPAECDTL